MLTWFFENWQLLFGGVGTAVVAAIIGYLLKRKKTEKAEHSQSIQSGSNSTNIQVGGDYSQGNNEQDR